MEPTHNSFTGSSELPQPQEVNSGQLPESQPASSPETQHNTPATGTPAAPVLPVTSVQQSVGSQPQAQSPSDTPTAATQHLMADDTDLIEKEWVTKAKAIVAHTKDDPFKQNQAMNKVKADYLKKRYNKDLKISES